MISTIQKRNNKSVKTCYNFPFIGIKKEAFFKKNGLPIAFFNKKHRKSISFFGLNKD
jgi:hypothetical protein